MAHALAYCRAAEVLAEGEPPPAALLLREVLLELERIHNHVADVGALAGDVALEAPAAEISVLREQLLRLNQQLTGHRYLRNVVRPGGIVLPGGLPAHMHAELPGTLARCLDRFGYLAGWITSRPGFRSRTIGVGVLTPSDVLELGATGLIARAAPRRPGSAARPRPRSRRAPGGDVYARCLTRITEVAQAHARVLELLDGWARFSPEDRSRLRSRLRVKPENNYTFAVGRADGFRARSSTG